MDPLYIRKTPRCHQHGIKFLQEFNIKTIKSRLFNILMRSYSSMQRKHERSYVFPKSRIAYLFTKYLRGKPLKGFWKHYLKIFLFTFLRIVTSSFNHLISMLIPLPKVSLVSYQNVAIRWDQKTNGCSERCLWGRHGQSSFKDENHVYPLNP